ncbi:MAG: neutral/alkaline non-lysosomal ceramidase N-terminal domain-containing protein, partial [Planctomycetota bacterium]
MRPRAEGSGFARTLGRAMERLARTPAILLVLAGAIGGLAPRAATAPDEPSGLEAGFGVVDLTPPGPVPLGGYGARRGRLSTGVHDPVRARALVLRRGATAVGLVSVDLVGVSRQVRELVARRLGDLDLDGLVLAATHTHAGPGALTDVPAWRPAMGAFDRHLLARTAARIEMAVRLAHADLAPAVLRGGRTDGRALAARVRNRAVRTGPVDSTVGVLRIDAPDGTPRGILVHFAAHPTLLPASVTRISAGWPGALCDALERALPGVRALFFNGALGDVAPVAEADAGPDPFAKARRYGETLAQVALGLHARLGREASPSTRLDVEPTTWVSVRTIAGPLLGLPGPSALVPDAAPPFPVEQLTLGTIRLRTLPGEPTVAFGRSLGQGADRWIVSCAQDHLGYFTDRALFRRGNTYEAELSFFGPALADRIRASLAGPPGSGQAGSGQAGSGRPADAPPRPAREARIVRIVADPRPGEGAAHALGRAHGERLREDVRSLL